MKIGDKINTFTLLELFKKGSNSKHILWKIQCNCGRELIKASNDIKRQKSCGCLNNKFEASKTMYGHLKGRHARYNGPLISYEKFLELSNSNCFYCNSSPANNSYGWTYNGIDRIDSDLGYTESNVRSCCWICNRMKGDLSEEEFFEHINKIKDLI